MPLQAIPNWHLISTHIRILALGSLVLPLQNATTTDDAVRLALAYFMPPPPAMAPQNLHLDPLLLVGMLFSAKLLSLAPK